MWFNVNKCKEMNIVAKKSEVPTYSDGVWAECDWLGKGSSGGSRLCHENADPVCSSDEKAKNSCKRSLRKCLKIKKMWILGCLCTNLCHGDTWNTEYNSGCDTSNKIYYFSVELVKANPNDKSWSSSPVRKAYNFLRLSIVVFFWGGAEGSWVKSLFKKYTQYGEGG